MRGRTTLAIAVGIALLVAACAGTDVKETTPEGAANTPEDEESEPPEREVKRKPRKPKPTYARAALKPVKGSKLEPTVVTFTQRKGKDTKVEADTFDGARPGTYWLVVHEGSSCGANATKAGPVWADMEEPLRVVIRRDLTGGLERSRSWLPLRGKDSAIGRVLVLHLDKRGKLGKALACGVIEEADEL